jgi:hypothetical protein
MSDKLKGFLVKGYVTICAVGWILFAITIPFMSADLVADIPVPNLRSVSSHESIVKLIQYSPIILSLIFWILPTGLLVKGKAYYFRLFITK